MMPHAVTNHTCKVDEHRKQISKAETGNDVMLAKDLTSTKKIKKNYHLEEFKKGSLANRTIATYPKHYMIPLKKGVRKILC